MLKFLTICCRWDPDPLHRGNHLHVRGSTRVVRDGARQRIPPCVETLPGLALGPRRTDHLHVRGDTNQPRDTYAGSGDPLHVRGEHVALPPGTAWPDRTTSRAWRALTLGRTGAVGRRTTSTCVEARAGAWWWRPPRTTSRVRGSTSRAARVAEVTDHSTCVESTPPMPRGLVVADLHVRESTPAWPEKLCLDRTTSTCVEALPTSTVEANSGPPPRAWESTFDSPAFFTDADHLRAWKLHSLYCGAPSRSADHLHVRGEHGPTAPVGDSSRGPPPRAWRALAEHP